VERAQEGRRRDAPICTALNEAAARTALEKLRRDLGKKSPGMVAAWERAWDNFVPFLAFDSAIRKVIYTTNGPTLSSQLTSSCGR
jgi:transposase-like protein